MYNLILYGKLNGLINTILPVFIKLFYLLFYLCVDGDKTKCLKLFRLLLFIRTMKLLVLLGFSSICVS